LLSKSTIQLIDFVFQQHDYIITNNENKTDQVPVQGQEIFCGWNTPK